MQDEATYEYRVVSGLGGGVAYALSRFMQRHGWRLQRRVATTEYSYLNNDDGWETISEEVKPS